MRPGPDSAPPRPAISGPAARATGIAEARRRSGAPVWAAWLAVAAWIGLVLWLGSGSFGAPSTSRILFPVLRWLFPELSVRELLDLAMQLRKLAHPSVYGVLALLALNAWRLSWPGPPWRAGALAFGLALGVACADETRQGFLPGRTGSLGDVVLDAAGALAAVVCALALVHARGRWEARRPFQRRAPRDRGGEP